MDGGRRGPLSGLGDERLGELMRVFPTKLEYLGFGTLAGSIALSVAAGSPPDPLGVAMFAWFAAECLLGGALIEEGARRGCSVEVGWVENSVTWGGGGDGR